MLYICTFLQRKTKTTKGGAMDKADTADRRVLYHIPLDNQGTKRPTASEGDPSCLGARELEHDDLVSKGTRDEDLVAVHKDCTNLTFQVDGNSL